MQSKDRERLLGKLRKLTYGDEEAEDSAGEDSRQWWRRADGEEESESWAGGRDMRSAETAGNAHWNDRPVANAAGYGGLARPAGDVNEAMNAEMDAMSTPNGSGKSNNGIVRLAHLIADDDDGQLNTGVADAKDAPREADENAMSANSGGERREAEVFVLSSIEERLSGIAAMADKKIKTSSAVERPHAQDRGRGANPFDSAYGGDKSTYSTYGMSASTEDDRSVREQEPRTGMIPAGEAQLWALLAELKGDIETLKHGSAHAVVPASTSGEDEMRALLFELKSDINAIKREQALETQSPEERELRTLLAALKSDIGALKREQTIETLPPEERELRTLLATLKTDIGALKAEQAALPMIAARPPTSQWGTSLMTAGLVLTVIGVAVGGYYLGTTGGSLLPQSKIVVAARAPAPTPAPIVERTTIAPPAATELPTSVEPIGSAEERELIERAQGLMDQGDISSARIVLDFAVSQGGATAAFYLAQTYDPKSLSQMKSVLGVAPDLTKAKTLYYFAARSGHQKARERLAEMRMAN